MLDELLVVIKGAGDLATGVGWRLHRCGLPVVMTEIPRPLTVRRLVAFAQAIYDGEHTVEGVTARRCALADVPDALLAGEVPVLVDPEATVVADLHPSVLVDGVMAKRNMGTTVEDAPLVIALGPGFTAGLDCHVVIETHRGHTLGRAIWQGSARPDTGNPGALPGVGEEATRVLRAPVAGRLRAHGSMGDRFDEGEPIAAVQTDAGGEVQLLAPFPGVLRGLIHEQVLLQPGLKIGDLDPRAEPEHAWTISDKSLAVGGGALEAILSWRTHRDDNPYDLDEAML